MAVVPRRGSWFPSLTFSASRHGLWQAQQVPPPQVGPHRSHALHCPGTLLLRGRVLEAVVLVVMNLAVHCGQLVDPVDGVCECVRLNPVRNLVLVVHGVGTHDRRRMVSKVRRTGLHARRARLIRVPARCGR